MNILVTGAAGFIGRAVCEQLLKQHHQVTGLDNLNSYYPVALKQARLATLTPYDYFDFCHQDIADAPNLISLFKTKQFTMVIHLAAQAGVRYSIENPQTYAQSNLVGFTNILESCRQYSVDHLIYASSSSVYGKNAKIPFSEEDNTDYPVSFYAATKKSNEVMAASYAHLYKIPATGLRFFTVYGPWGRPDMAPWLFTEAIIKKQPIKVFNHGKMQRDFTYIDDIVSGVLAVASHRPSGSLSHRILNIGNHQPVELMTFIQTVEQACGNEAIKEFLPMQDGDVPVTYADTTKLRTLTGFSPDTPLLQGIKNFVAWYKQYYCIN